MDKKEIMKHIVGNDSDDEIKWEFYHEIIYSQFNVCSLWTDSYDKTNLVEAEEWFAELKQQLEVAGFTCVDIISNDNSNEYTYRLEATDAYIKLCQRIYSIRFHNEQETCSIYMAIYLDQFKGKVLSYSNGENNAGFDIGDQKDAVSLAVSFIRNIPQYEKQWEEFDIAAIHKELEKFIRNSASSCSRLGDLYFKIRTEQENDEDFVFGDMYGNWQNPDELQ